MSQEFPTEEDLRLRLLLPYLSALGFEANQIRCEQRFRLQLGRTAVELGTQDFRTSMAGRLDILVRDHRGQNLFVVELKAESQALTEKDRDQGISYARLLDQIAPFVLLTNGRQSQLYDS